MVWSLKILNNKEMVGTSFKLFLDQSLQLKK